MKAKLFIALLLVSSTSMADGFKWFINTDGEPISVYNIEQSGYVPDPNGKYVQFDSDNKYGKATFLVLCNSDTRVAMLLTNVDGVAYAGSPMLAPKQSLMADMMQYACKRVFKK